MNTFATKFAVTASIAALILAAPVSVDLTSAGLSVTAAQAQAHESRGGHEHADRQAGSHRAANGDHQAAGRADQRTGQFTNANANGMRANDIRGNDIKTNDVRANDVRVNNARINNANVNNVNVNDVKVNDVNSAYVRPPYIAPRVGYAVAGAAVAVGTTVAVLPASCTTVVYDNTVYHHCGDTYYIASDGAYVAVNAPR
jgi:hypothetical protein